MTRPILFLICTLCLSASGLLQADGPQAPPIVNGARPALGGAPSSQPDQPAASAAPSIPGFEQRLIGGPDGQRSPSADNSLSGWLGSTWWAMVVVIGLILLAAWAVRRWAPGPLSGRGGGPFRVLSRWHLSAKQYVALIQLGRRMLLVGVTGQQMSLLAEVTDPAEVEHLLASCPSGRSILSDGFGQLLGRQREEMSAGDEEEGVVEGPARRASGQLGRLVGQVKSRLMRLKSGSGRGE